jgi:phosphomannomutase/phosphoglucomutase
VVELLKKTRTQKKAKEPLSSLIADLPKTFNTPEIRFDCPDALKFKVVDRVRELYAHPEKIALSVREVITVDGIRAVFQNGWGLIRSSNTQPVLVMRFEAVDQASLQSIRSLMEDQVRKMIAGLS